VTAKKLVLPETSRRGSAAWLAEVRKASNGQQMAQDKTLAAQAALLGMRFVYVDRDPRCAGVHGGGCGRGKGGGGVCDPLSQQKKGGEKILKKSWRKTRKHTKRKRDQPYSKKHTPTKRSNWRQP